MVGAPHERAIQLLGKQFVLGRHIAEALGEHPKTVSRQWLAATIKLKPYLPQDES
mgnify:CR=1 FL=1